MKKITRRSFLQASSAACIASAFTACSSTEETTTTTTTTTTSTDTSSDAEEDVVVADAEVSFKLAENQPENNPITEGMYLFAELAYEKSNGTVILDVYADAALGAENENIDQVQAGTLDFARVNTSALSATVAEVELYGLPYVFNDTEHKYQVLDGDIGQSTLATLSDFNMVGLEYWEAGSRNFYTNSTPITCVADLAGLKIRVQTSEVAMSMVELLGAVPTSMDYGEVFQGLQTGVIDGAENDFVSYYTSGHYEAAKHFSLDGHMAPPAVVLCSQAAWDSMSEAQQTAVSEAAKEAAVWQRTAMDDYQDESRTLVVEAGCTIYDVDVSEFQDATAALFDSYPQYADQVAQIRAL